MKKIINFFRSLSPLQKLFQYIIQRSLSSYITTEINYESLFAKGYLLNDLELNVKQLSKNLLAENLFILKKGRIKNLEVTIPWTEIFNKNTFLKIEEIEIILIINKNYGRHLNEKISEEQQEKQNENEPEMKDEKDVFLQIVEKIFFNFKIVCKELKLVMFLSDDRKINFNFNNMSFEFKKVDMIINYILNIENIWLSLHNNEQIICNIEGIESPYKKKIKIEAQLNRKTKRIQSITCQLPLLQFLFEVDELIAFTDILFEIQNLFSCQKLYSKDNSIGSVLQNPQVLPKKEEFKHDSNHENDQIQILDLLISDYFKTDSKNEGFQKIELENGISNITKASQKSTSLVTKSKNNNELVELIFEPLKNLIDDYYNACFEKGNNTTEEGELSEEDAEILKNLVDATKDGEKNCFLNQKIANQLKLEIEDINFGIFQYQNKGKIKKNWKGLPNNEIMPFLNERNQFFISINEVKFDGSLKLEEMRVYLSSFRLLDVDYENEGTNMKKEEENEKKNDSFFSFDSINNEDDNISIKEIFAVYDSNDEENSLIKKEWKLNDQISASYRRIQLKKFQNPEKKQIEIILSTFNKNVINLSICFNKKIHFCLEEKFLNRIQNFLERINSAESKTNIKTEKINNEEMVHDDSYPLSLSSFYSFENEFEKKGILHKKDSNILNIKFEIPCLEIVLLDNSNTNFYISINKLTFDSEDLENLKKIDLQITDEIEFSFLFFTNEILSTSSFLKVCGLSNQKDSINNLMIKINSKDTLNHILHENDDDNIQFEMKNKVNFDVSFNKIDLYLNFEIFENYVAVINSAIALWIKCLVIFNLQKTLIIPKKNQQENEETEKSLDFDMLEHNQDNQFLSRCSFREINIFIGENLNIKKLITINLNMLQLFCLKNYRNEYFLQGCIFDCYINLFNGKVFFFPYFDLDYCLSSRMASEERENYLIYKQAYGLKERERFVKDFNAKKLLENKIDNIVVFKFNISYNDKKKKNSPLIKDDAEEFLSDLNESSFEDEYKRIKIFFGLNNLIVKPYNLLLLSNSSIILECKKLNERFKNKVIIKAGESEKGVAPENLSLKIEGNKICIDLFPFKQLEKSNLLHCSSIRSLITIDELLFSFSSIDGEISKSVDVTEIQIFLWKIPNIIKINQTNLFVFQNLYDVENILNVYHKTILEKFCFNNIFTLKSFETQISKKVFLSISKIEFELFEDSVSILSSHFKDLTEFFNILSDSFIRKVEEKKSNVVIHEDSDSFEIDLDFFNSSNDEEKLDIEKIEHQMENSIPKKEELINLKINDVKFNLSSGAQFTVMDDFLFEFKEIFEKEKNLSILKSALLPKYFSESRLNKKAEKMFGSLYRSHTTCPFFKNGGWQLQFILKNFGFSVNPEDKNEKKNFTIQLEKLKVFRIANDQKIKIFSKIKSEENNDIIVCKLNFNELMQLEKIHIKNSSFKIFLDKNVIKNFEQIHKAFEKKERKSKPMKSEKSDTFISLFRIDGFYISIDYEPNFEDLQNILRDPINIINIGKISDLQIMCNSVCYRGINLEKICSTYLENLIEDIKCNQKTNIIKKLPYINQIFKAIDSVKSFMADLKICEQNEMHRLLNVLLTLFYMKKE